MDDIRIEVEGAAELAKAMRQAGDEELPKSLRAIHKKLAEIVINDALPNVPVGKTGKLKKSVKALATQTKASAKAGTAKSVPYAPAVHWGTGPRSGLRGPHNISRRPFLWDALNRERPNVEKEYLDELDDLLDKAVRGR